MEPDQKPAAPDGSSADVQGADYNKDTQPTSLRLEPFSNVIGVLCLLFIHPRAPNLINLRSAGTMPA